MARVDTSGIEKHIITIAVSVMTALLLWIGYSTNNTAISVAEMRVELRGLSTSVHDQGKRIHELELRD